MTTTPPCQPDLESTGPDLFDAVSNAAPVAGIMLEAGFGSRLRAAREAHGWQLDACAHALRLPLHILRKLEQGEHEGVDSKIYLASYIGTYGRYLGVDEAAIQTEQARIRQAEPPLVATGGISHSRFLLDRYATAATYLVLTLVIAVPTIWFGVRSTLDRDLSHLTPLDASPVAQQDAQAAVPASKPDASAPVAPAKAVVAQPAPEQPLMASMAPFPNLGNDAPQPAAAVDAAGHSLSLNLSAASWVEVVAQDGTRLEYGLLPAGSDKTWHSDKPLDVRIGNAVGAQVSIDGQPVSMDGYRHANVAHFRVQIADGKASAASF